MRELGGRSRLRFARRRRASVWLAVASFLGLLLTQGVHGSEARAAARVAGAGQPVAQNDLPAHECAHHPGLCALCRVATQTRCGLRAPVQALEARGTVAPLHLPAPVPPSAAPELRSARPRAPPSPLALSS
jgi:hypothetical protein